MLTLKCEMTVTGELPILDRIGQNVCCLTKMNFNFQILIFSFGPRKNGKCEEEVLNVL